MPKNIEEQQRTAWKSRSYIQVEQRTAWKGGSYMVIHTS
jgi:hypothetical protein